MTGGGVEILHATAWYGPGHTGGTESYVEDLVGALALLGIGGTVLAPRGPGEPASYRQAGHPVETYPVDAPSGRDEIGADAVHGGFDAFRHLLAAHPGAVYHQHAWSRGCGPHHLRAARELGLRTVLTIHVAGALCLRGTMLHFGAEPCDGRVEAVRCGACWAHGRGMPRALAWPLAAMPLSLARRWPRGRSSAATALATRAIGAERAGRFRRMIADADRVVVVCGWLHDALAANGVPPAKLCLSRQGVSEAFAAAAYAAPLAASGFSLRLLFLGRWDPIKGIDVLVRAVRSCGADLVLTVHAAAARTDGERAHEAEVRAIAGDDPRIRFAGPVARGDVAAAMAHHHAVAVPSLLMETGPLVALEARAVGLFVLGSRLGGIAELVRDGEGGELVSAGDAAAWGEAIARLAARCAAGAPLSGKASVRTMADVAAEMAELYGSV